MRKKTYEKFGEIYMKTLSLVFLLLALSVSGLAQNFDKAKLDKFFDVLTEKDQAMGSLTISKNGQVLYSRAVGYRQISEKEKTPADARTKYRIGSISKMFTTTLIFQLVEAGKLKLTDTLDKFFPEIPNAKKITVAQMLDHHSGIHNITNDVEEYLSYYTKPQTQAQMVALIAKTKPDFEPGTKADYSNSNFILLGYIVEKITKKPFATVLKEKITAKIGLADTFYGGKINAANNESFSYDFENGWKQTPETDMSVPGGAGAIVSTPTDLTKFIEALFSVKLVSPKSLDQMKTLTDNYGMGMFQFPVGSRKGYGHNGGIDGFNSMLVYLPEEKLSVAYISNGTVYAPANIVSAAAAVYFNEPFTIPTFEKIVIKAEDLAKFAGIYSAAGFPLKISVTAQGTTLYAQATGQSAFPLEATDKNKFKFDAAGIVLEFEAEKNQMTLKQGGRTTIFTKEK